MKLRKVKAMIGVAAIAAAMTFTACGHKEAGSVSITVEGTDGNASLSTEKASESATTSTEAAAVQEPGTTDDTAAAATESASTEVTAQAGLAVNGQTTNAAGTANTTGNNTGNNTAGGTAGNSTGSAGTASGSAAAGTSGTVSETVNLRSASDSNTVIGAVYPGQTVTVTGESGDYYTVSVGGQTGLIAKQYFTTGAVSSTGSGTGTGAGTSSGNTSGTQTSESTGTSGAVSGTMSTTDDVKLRSSGDYSIITTIPAGTAVTVTGDAGNGWYTVTYNGQTGVVSSVYLR